MSSSFGISKHRKSGKTGKSPAFRVTFAVEHRRNQEKAEQQRKSRKCPMYSSIAELMRQSTAGR